MSKVLLCIVSVITCHISHLHVYHNRIVSYLAFMFCLCLAFCMLRAFSRKNLNLKMSILCFIWIYVLRSFPSLPFFFSAHAFFSHFCQGVMWWMVDDCSQTLPSHSHIPKPKSHFSSSWSQMSNLNIRDQDKTQEQLFKFYKKIIQIISWIKYQMASKNLVAIITGEDWRWP